MTTIAKFLPNSTEDTLNVVKRGLTNGNLLPTAFCHKNEAYEWSYEFAFHVPGCLNTIFAAAVGHGNLSFNGLPLRTTQYPPLVRATKNAAVNPGNLKIIHEPGNLQVTILPLGDTGDAIIPEAPAIPGTRTPMTRLYANTKS